MRAALCVSPALAVRPRGLGNLLSLFLAFLLCLVPAPAGRASDWVEDNGAPATAAPPVAPPIGGQGYRSSPPEQQGPPGAPEEGDPGRTAFYVRPRSPASESKSGTPLEASVSKWGMAGQEQGNLYQGRASTLIQTPPYQPSFFQLSSMRSVGPGVFRGWLEKTHSRFALATSTMDPMLVLEIKGQWDDADHTLRSFGIRHTTIKKGRLDDQPLDGVKVLVVNCAGNVPRGTFQKIRDFVARGGFLISTDWTVHNLVENAFPGYIAWNGGKTDSKVVDATVTYPDPRLFAGAVQNSGWKLDDGSQTIRVLRPDVVRVLVRSRMLTGEDPDRLGILAVVFPFGRGQVLHLVGHFDNNANLAFTNLLPDPAPVIGISLRQALACNFLVEGLEQSGAVPSGPVNPRR